MEQKKEQKKEFFQEMKQIYNINIPILKSAITKENQVQKILFYIDLTNTLNYSNALFQLSIKNSIQKLWQGGFLTEFLFNNKQNEKESIFCYYFNKLIENDEQINKQNLFRFRILLQEFISTQQKYQMKFVFHFRQKNDNQKEFEDHIVKYIYLILDGSFDKLYDIICVYNKQENEQINYCKISYKKIHLKKNQCYDTFDISFIQKLDGFLNYYQFQQNNPNFIGYTCQQYVQEQVNVVLKEFEKELQSLQKDIQLMIEFPVNLNNEKEINQNVSQYLECLKAIIFEIYFILKEHREIDQIAQKLPKVLNNQRQNMIKNLCDIVAQNTQFEIYLQLTNKGKSPIDVFNQLLQFQFELLESDNQILQKLKKHNYNQDCINATLLRVILDTKQWYEQFDLYLPQSIAYMKRIIPKKQNINLDKPCVFVLGMTRVGKSTLLNILSNPENIIVNEDKKFDVKEKDKKILISHENNSATFQMEQLEIDNFIFYDSPGLGDTSTINRVINHFNIFNQITNAKQQILLLMIDGEELTKKKNDLIDSIALINSLFGKQIDDKCLENLIIPVFTKIRNDSTMKLIKDKWQSGTMKDITDQFQLKILNVIKKAIEKENYIKIYCAEYYQIQDEQKQLESEIQKMNAKALEYFGKQQYQQGQELLTQVKLKQNYLDNLQQVSFLQKIKKIKDDLLGKCQNILEARQNNDQSLNVKFQLTPELQDYLQKLLVHRNKFYQHILNIIINDFIAKMLYDYSISIEDKFSEILLITFIRKQKLSDIPKQIISKNIQVQIDQLDHFSSIISNYDNKNQVDLAVDFLYFNLQLKQIGSAFIEAKVLSNYQTLKEFLFCGWSSIKKIGQGIFMTIFTVVSIPYLLITGVNHLFSRNLFVSEKEKEKKEKLNLFKIQQEYYKLLQEIK